MRSCALLIVFIIALGLILFLGLGNEIKQVVSMFFDLVKIVIQGLIDYIKAPTPTVFDVQPMNYMY